MIVTDEPREMEKPNLMDTEDFVHNRNTISPVHSPRIVQSYNLTSGSPFTPMQSIPPAFITLQFADQPYHSFVASGRWKLDEAARELRSKLIKSRKSLSRPAPPPFNARELRILRTPPQTVVRGDNFDDLILQYGPLSFLHVDGQHLTSYATTPEAAEQLAMDFAAKYERPTEAKRGSYVLIKYQRDDIGTHSVPLKPSMLIREERLNLLYGSDFSEWHQRFVQLLELRTNGISFFDGCPGTGKTSYIRHLICSLESTHRFYFIPHGTLDILSRPDFIDFWSSQTKHFPDRQFVVILEDAENALMRRGSDNARMVSAILNLTDGMMADFLQIQFICTINCKITELDQALLRPGRLISHRHFRKLERKEALALADALGKSLPERDDYTLAEIFTEDEFEGIAQPKAKRTNIGFNVG